MNDAICPWLGFKPYEEKDAPFFNGRSSAINALLDIVEEKTITVCYAESGIGKTSLINAGLVPNIREKDFIPIWIRFDVKNLEGKTKKEEVRDLLCNHFLSVFHRAKKEFEKKNQPYTLIWDIPDENHKVTLFDLWKVLRSTPKVSVFNGIEYLPVYYKPFIILDQFEQMLFDSNSQMVIESFFELLKALVLNDTFGDEYLRMKEKELVKDGEDSFKVLVSLRQEYIGVLDYWCMTRVPMPSLHDNRYSLQPLTTQEAREVVLPKGYDIFEDAAGQIIEIAKENNAVSSILLSVICRRLYEQTPSKEGAKLKVSEGEVEKKKESIIKDYYDEQLKKAQHENESLLSEDIITQIEDVLVSDDGKRFLMAVKNGCLQGINFSEDIRLLLENNGIIRSDRIGENTFVELIHDRVAVAVLERKKERKEKENNKKIIERRRFANLKKYKSKRNILTLAGRRLMDNCGFDFTEDNSRTIVSGNSKNQLKNQSLSSIHSREYDGSDNVFVADILNQTVENDDLFFHFNNSLTKDGFKALGVKTQLLKTQRIINGIEFYGSKACDIHVCSAEGFNGIHIDCDPDGNEKMRVYSHSEDGINVSGVTCYEIVESDEDGFPLKILFKDENGILCKHFDGNYGIEFKYDQYGNEEYRRYLDKDGKSSCKIYNQVCGLKSEYKEDRVVLQYFVDENGKITADAYGIVGVKYSYYEEIGEISSIDYIGKDRKRCINPYGYCVEKFYYRDGKRYRNRYYSEDGETPVNRMDGELSYSILDIIGYDKCDRIKGYILRDIDESLKLKIVYTYDSIGHVTDTKYYAGNGSLCTNPSGVHHIKYEYYDNGLLKCQSHFGINNSPVEDINGNHKAIFEWDDQGRLYQRHFFKSNNNNSYNSQEFIYKSDAQCSVKDTTYIDAGGNFLEKPIEERQEWVMNHQFQAKEIIFGEDNYFIRGRSIGVRFKYNIAGDVTECRFIDKESKEPIADNDGDFGWQIEKYGVSGEIRTFLDKNGECCRNKHPYAIVIKDNIMYQGEECTISTYFDENNKPVLHENGYHKKIESGFSGDELNKLAFFFDCQGNPCNIENGYAKQIYEERNNGENEIIRIVYFVDAGNRPVINKAQGFHKREQILTNNGFEICRSFYDENNSLINVPEGFAKQKCKRYDSFWTIFYYPFEDHNIIRFYDKNDKKVDVDFECEIKGIPQSFHAYKFITPLGQLDESPFFKVETTTKKTLYRDWTIMWKCVFVVLVPLAIIMTLLVYPCYYFFNKLINIFRSKKTIQDCTCSIIKVAQVFDEVQKGNDSIVSPAKSIGITDGCWIVKWNHWVYNKDDSDTIEKFEKEFNAAAEFKSITLYNPSEKKFFNLYIREKNLGLRLKDAPAPVDYVNEMMRKALSLSPNENADLLRIIYSNMAGIYKEKEEYDKAEGLYRKQIAIMEKQGEYVSRHDLADAYDDLGVCLFQLDRKNEAVEALNHALEIIGDMKDENSLIAIIHNHIAQVFRIGEEFEKAECHYKECVKYTEKTEGVSGDDIADGLMKVGVMLARQEKYDECLEVTERALSLTSEDNFSLLQSIHLNLAYLYKEKSECDKAGEHYRDLIAIMEKQGEYVSRHDLADAYDDLGVCLFQRDKNVEAIEAFEKALTVLGNSKDETQLNAIIHNHLSKAYRADNNIEKADYHNDIYVNLKKSFEE